MAEAPTFDTQVQFQWTHLQRRTPCYALKKLWTHSSKGTQTALRRAIDDPAGTPAAGDNRSQLAEVGKKYPRPSGGHRGGPARPFHHSGEYGARLGTAANSSRSAKDKRHAVAFPQLV